MKEKLLRLRQYLKSTDGIAVAFSGGVDSSFLVAVAAGELGDKAIAITAKSAAFPVREYELAKGLAAQYGIRHITVEFDELSVEGFRKNPKDRCYHCKRAIFSKIKEEAHNNGIEIVCDGSNVDDLSDYRPGMKALTELGIVSPLKEAGLTKQEIRLLSKEMGIKIWDMPAYACLASRIPYNEEITREKLKMVELAEQYLMDLGFKQVRVRCHDSLARIEVLPEDRHRFFNTDFMDNVARNVRSFGFNYVTLDLNGYRMGSLNETIK
jgi:uncharacterized protein